MAPNSVRSVDVVNTDNNILASTKNATSIAELVSTIPQSWRPSLGSYLTQVYRVASKMCTVQNTIAQYERHTADGSFPALVSNCVKVPKLQFSKEHLGTEDGKLSKSMLESEIQTARKSVLAYALKSKKEELATLQGCVSFDSNSWRSTVLETAKRVAQVLDVSVQTSNTTDADLVWSPITAGGGAAAEAKTLWKYGNVFHYRAVALARSIADRSLVEKVRTLSLKKEADHEMNDQDSEKPTRELVRDEMQAQLRLLETRLARSFGQARKSAPPKKKGGSNPSGVQKTQPKKKGKGKGKGKK